MKRVRAEPFLATGGRCGASIMTKIIAILLAGLVFEAVGVMFLSEGLKAIHGVRQITVPEIARVIADGATNHKILLGVFFESIFFGALLYLLSCRDVSLIWPLTSLGFVITTFAAKMYLHERVSTIRWAGVILIVLGASLGIYSEKAKEKTPDNPPSQGTSNP